jgi:hypothetical protein
MNALLKSIDRVVEGRALGRALLVLTPLIAATFGTGDPLWMLASLVTASSFIAMEQVKLAPLGVALYGLAIAIGYLLLMVTLPFPPLFALATAGLATSAVLVSAKGHRLRKPGNFVFIASLYTTCELAEIWNGPSIEGALAFLPYLAVALVPVLLLSAVEHAHDRDQNVAPFAHLVSIRSRRGELGSAVPVGQAAAAIAGAVAVAALLIEWRHPSHSQWIVWSAASVVTGDVNSARRKLSDRALGALIGVPIGIALALPSPDASWLLKSAAVVGLLSLIMFRHYPIEFGVRCAVIAFALTIAGELSGAAVRVENVLVGGAIGLALVFATHVVAKHFAGKSSSRLSRPGRDRVPTRWDTQRPSPHRPCCSKYLDPHTQGEIK